MLNPQADPPHVELREPVDAGGGKRHSVVRPDRSRQSGTRERGDRRWAGPPTLSGEQALAAEQEARVLIRHGQRVAFGVYFLT